MIRYRRRFDPSSIRLLIFDLDGTLIDSRLDLIHSVNAMLRYFERPELDGDVIASYVGDGAPALVRRALAGRNGEPDDAKGQFGKAESQSDEADEAFFRSALEYFIGYYRLHKLDHTTVYDGIPETLAALAGAASVVGHQSQTSRVMAVLSNKPVNPSRDIVAAMGLGDYFIRIYGGNSFPTKKPDPLGARKILEETDVAPAEALIIGDSSIDVLTGRNAGLWTCGVTYGFAPHSLETIEPDVLIENPRELTALFQSST